MAQVLYIKANAKTEEESRTYQVSEQFIEKYRELHPEDEIITLDLYKEGIDFLPVGEIMELHVPAEGTKKDHPILKYAYQFAQADKYVIAAPFWNLSFPAILKAYLDYISVVGITFKYTANGPVGLCANKKVVHIVGRGGVYSEGPTADFELGDRYLRTLFAFFGITDFSTIAAEGLDVVGNDVQKILNEAIEKAYDLAKRF